MVSMSFPIGTRVRCVYPGYEDAGEGVVTEVTEAIGQFRVVFDKPGWEMSQWWSFASSFVAIGGPPIEGLTPKQVCTGHKCTGCGTFNEYAEANRADGSYLCFECR